MPTTEIDKELAAALMAAKSKEYRFAIVAKGPAVVKLIVSKMPIKDSEVQAAKKKQGGNAVLRGKCQGESGELVFRVAKEPTVSDKKLKEFIVTATKLSVKPRFEVLADGSIEEEEEGTEAETQEAVTGEEKPETPAAPPQPPASTGDMAAFANRLKAIKPELDEVREGETTVTAEVKALSSELGVLAGKKQFAEAGGVLDRLEPLVKKGLAELSAKPSKAGVPPPAKEPAKAPAGNTGATFAERLKALRPEMDKAILEKSPLGQQVKLHASEMSVAAKKGDFTAAFRSLDQIEQLLRGGAAVTGSSAPRQATLPVWRDARELVGEQIGKLQSYLKGVADPLAQRVADQGLNGLTQKLQVGLQVALMEFDNATGDARQKSRAKAQAAIAALRAFLKTHPALPLLEKNPFGVKVAIRTTLGGALDVLEKALAA